MGTNTISSISDGTTGTASQVNQYRTALIGDHAPRNSSGVATDISASLGSSTYRWLKAYVKSIFIGEIASGNSIEDDSGDMVFKVNGAEVARLGTSNYTGYEPLGTVKASVLTNTQYQAIMGTGWVQINGQSISGSDLHTLTGLATLPTLVDGGTLVESDSDGNLGTNTTGEVKAHSHTVTRHTFGGTDAVYGVSSGDSSFQSGFIGSTGGSNNLAAGMKVYHYIKINN